MQHTQWCFEALLQSAGKCFAPVELHRMGQQLGRVACLCCLLAVQEQCPCLSPYYSVTLWFADMLMVQEQTDLYMHLTHVVLLMSVQDKQHLAVLVALQQCHSSTKTVPTCVWVSPTAVRNQCWTATSTAYSHSVSHSSAGLHYTIHMTPTCCVQHTSLCPLLCYTLPGAGSCSSARGHGSRSIIAH